MANANLYGLMMPRSDMGITRKDVTKIFIQEFANQRGGSAEAIGADMLDQLRHRMTSAGGSNRDIASEIRDAVMDANGAKIVRYAGSIAWGAIREAGSATLSAPRTGATAVKAFAAASVIGILGCLSSNSKLVLTAFWDRLMQLDRNPYYFNPDDKEVYAGYLDYLTYTYLSSGRLQPQHTG